MSDDIQKRNVAHFVQEFEYELKDVSGKCINVDSGFGEITRNILLPALNQDAVMIGENKRKAKTTESYASENMVEYANRMHGIDELLRYETLDIQTKGLPEKYIAEFDHVFSFPVLHFCNDIRQGFENIYNMLRPGGTFFMLWVSSHDMFKILEIMAENKRFASYLYKYTASFLDLDRPQVKLKKLFRSVGFRIHHCSNRDMNFINTDPYVFLLTIMSAFTFLHEMPSDRVENFKNEFTWEYMKENKYTRAAGGRHIPSINSARTKIIE
ncbi:hypothetical protein ALC62_09277 [Cyphomyrmex costatus]|uniref:Methyltransferase type 11 domain-containing protein n=1 Tax=Cyphomyrmex costatus TaxID=456900 RepID=A0A151IFR2_9HYME|nr:hypothetical protein ALC62_09277 [Cyphomyrmex costatus]